MNSIDPKKSKDIPVTKIMLDNLRGEVKSDISSLQLEMKSKFNKVDARFDQIDSRFEQIDSRFKQVDSRFDQMELKFEQLRKEVKSDVSKVQSDISKVLSAVHRVSVLVEEQNARNNFVLDGYTQLHDKIKYLELNKADKIDSTSSI